MAVKEKDLEKLKGEMPYKWREQSVNSRGATMVAYIDARQLFDKLDEVIGQANWQSDFKLIDGKLFGGIGILIERKDGNEWVWKWDTGSESNVEKEKGEVSDCQKRAGVHWGVGRFLYSLGIVTLKSAEYNGKYRPADDSGNIIWDKQVLTDLCMKAVVDGKLDRTRINSTSTPKVNTKNNTSSSPVATPKPWLNQNTDLFEDTMKSLKDGSITLSEIILKYNLSKATKAKLESTV